MRYRLVHKGESRSFPPGDAFLSGATEDSDAEVVLCLGTPPTLEATRAAILVELGTEALAHHVDTTDPKISNVLGFAKYRNGADAPSKLVEVVRGPRTSDEAVAAARSVFEDAGLSVSVCTDQAGRILDRLLRPKYNAALRFLDEGLASAKDIDTTCKLGLGYSDGPIERVERGGLVYHHDVSRALFETFGTAGYAPAFRSVAAKQRNSR